MLMYFLLPHWVPATWRSLAQTSMRAELPSGKQPTTLVLQADFDLLEVLTKWKRMPTAEPYQKVDIFQNIYLPRRRGQALRQREQMADDINQGSEN